jgi:hypothetical protein
LAPRFAANLARRTRTVTSGDRVRLSERLTFTDGHVGREFIVEKRGRSRVSRDPATGGGYRISRFLEREWSVVPVTKVHKTVFA